jgi:hypothetical protein
MDLLTFGNELLNTFIDKPSIFPGHSIFRYEGGDRRVINNVERGESGLNVDPKNS